MEHAVGGECAASGHRCERGPQCEREVSFLTTRYDLEEGELFLASDRRRSGRPTQQVQTDGSRQWLANLCDRRWPWPAVGELELHRRVLWPAGANEVPDPRHRQHRALLTRLQVPGGCKDRHGSRIGSAVEVHEA